jgi:repressor LexA
MAKSKTLDDIRDLRGPFNALIVRSMRKNEIKEITKWADHFGIGRTTLYNLLRGRETETGTWVTPSIETLIKLARAFNKPLHELIYMVEPDAPGAEQYEEELSKLPIKRVEVGVAGWVGAGPEQFEWCDEKIWIDADFAKGKDLIAFRIRGDSMAGGRRPIFDGDTVVVNQLDKGENNAPVVARLVGDGYVCKLLKDDKYSNVVKLASANPEHLNGTPTSVPPDQVDEIVGRVVRIIHNEV